MKIAIVTDAWEPQVNGVVRTIQAVTRIIARSGHEVMIVSPDMFRTLPCPTYPEIRLALTTPGRVGGLLRAFGAEAIHISTEGPLGLAARRWCLREKRPFTTAYHTQFPQYVSRRSPIPEWLVWRYVRWFHRPAAAVMAATGRLRAELNAQGLTKTRHWGRGVDAGVFGFDVQPPASFAGLARPIQLSVGRVAIEKNLEAFLELDTPGTKVIVGDGPARAHLSARFPKARFVGALFGAELAGAYAAADVFVFPSRTDTFGLVMIEALACGTPVAAFPVPGPLDIVNLAVGALSEDLGEAIERALGCDRNACTAHAQRFSWEASAAEFLANLACATAAPDVRPSAVRQGLALREHAH